MRVLVYGDLRTHHAQNWLEGLRRTNLSVEALSSTTDPDGAGDHDANGRDVTAHLRSFVVRHRLNVRMNRVVSRVRTQRWEPLQSLETLLTVPRYTAQAASLREAVKAARPDVVHALRTPYEGLIAATALRETPVTLTLSTWGQDFRAQAAREPMLRAWMRKALPRFDGVHVDALEDVAAARRYGLRSGVPAIHAAGNFGVRDELFYTGPKTPYLVLYPRGLRSYVRHERFLDMVERSRGSKWQFVGVGLTEDPRAVEMARDPASHLRLIPQLGQEEYAALVRQATVVVSPAVSDGTPNTLVEAMKCGAFIVAADIETVRSYVSRVGAEAMLLAADQREAWAEALRALNDATGRSGSPSNALRVPDEFDRTYNVTAFESFFAEVDERTRHAASRS